MLRPGNLWMSSRTVSPLKESERRTNMLRNFIYANGLEEADVIVAQKRGWNVFDHFIIYLGFKFGQHLFIANDTQGGVRWFSEKEIINLIADFEPVKIRRFSGNL